MRPREINPKCNRANCEENMEGYCMILNNTNFGQRGCTFFKRRNDDGRKENPAGSGKAE